MRPNKILSLLLAILLVITSSVTAFAAETQLNDLRYDEILEGLSVVVSDKTTPAVNIGMTEWEENPKNQIYYFFDANHNKLGYINGEAYYIIWQRAEAKCPGQLNTLPGGPEKWYAKIFNDYRKGANLTISKLPPDTPMMSDNPIQAAPAEHALKDKINAVTLQPVTVETWNTDFCSRIQKLADSKTTNYEKMWAVYNDIAANFNKKKNCVGYAVALKCAFDVVGFKTYCMRGNVTAVGGGWTAHSWVGVEIDGKLYYFDANLPGKHGGSLETYFAVSPKNATFYKDARIEELEITSPESSTLKILKIYDIPSKLL